MHINYQSLVANFDAVLIQLLMMLMMHLMLLSRKHDFQP